MKDVEKLKKITTRNEKTISQHTLKIENKLEIEEHESLKEIIVQLPDVNDVKELKDFIYTNIEKFSLDNRNFKKEWDVQNEIIRRYD